MQGAKSPHGEDGEDFWGSSSCLEVMSSNASDLPDLDHTIFLVQEDPEAEKRPWSPTRKVCDPDAKPGSKRREPVASAMDDVMGETR